jgi:hypothetical protein
VKSEEVPAASQQLVKNSLTLTNTQIIAKEILFEAAFSMQSVPVRWWPADNNMSMEAEESPLL